MKYSYETTIATWIDDKQLLILTKKIAKELKLNICEIEQETDIYGVPYFFGIIDGKKLTTSILKNLKEMIVTENSKEFGILLTSKADCKIPGAIKKFFIKQQEVISLEWLKTTILNKRYAIKRHKENKRSYDKTLFRTVFILRKLMMPRTILYMEDLCSEFNVSEKTIKRDINLLRSMGEEIVYDKNRNGYALVFSTSRI